MYLDDFIFTFMIVRADSLLIEHYSLLCFVLDSALTCTRQERVSERYRNTMKDLLLPSTISQKVERPHTARLDGTAMPHVDI